MEHAELSSPARVARADTGTGATRTVLLLNANADGGRAASLKRPIEDWLSVHHRRAMLFVSHQAALARQIVDALPAGSRVVVVGGDGSVGQLLPSLHAGRHQLGLVPVGTGNDTAAALGLAGTSWREALAHALHGDATAIDLGEARWTNARGHEQQALFISSLCTGFDAAVNRHASTLPRWLAGQPRYLAATLLELMALREFDLSTVVDGRAIHAGPVLLASTLNTRTYGGGMPIAPEARLDDGMLDLMLADGMGLAHVLRLLPRMLAGRHLGQPGVRHLRFRELDLRSATPVPLAADGETLGDALSVRITVKPGALAAVRKVAGAASR